MNISVEPSGKDALVTVADNGCGMSKEVIGQMQQGNFTTKGENGSGLSGPASTG